MCLSTEERTALVTLSFYYERERVPIMAARKSKRPKDSKFTAPLIFLRKSEEEQRQSGVVKPSLKSFILREGCKREFDVLCRWSLRRGVVGEK